MGFSRWPPIWRVMLITFLVIIFLNLVSSSINYYIYVIGACFAIPHISWLVARLIKRRLLPQTFVSPSRKCVLVTGCDSGFGNLVARRLDNYGFKVFAGCLFPGGDGALKLQQESSKTLKIVKLDVTKKEDVDMVVKEIGASGLELWAVINNAGVAQYLPAEWGQDVTEYERMFNVNVYGLVRVTKSCLPLLRKAKGRVINLSSMAGRITFTGLTQYCMSKCAVTAFSDGLRREMYAFGVKVVAVEPLMYATNIMNQDQLFSSIERSWNETNESVKSDYGLTYKERFKKRLANSLGVCRPNINEVIDSIEEAVTSDDPEIYYRCCGPLDRPCLWLLCQTSGLGQDYILTGSTWANFLKWFSFK